MVLFTNSVGCYRRLSEGSRPRRHIRLLLRILHAEPFPQSAWVGRRWLKAQIGSFDQYLMPSDTEQAVVSVPLQIGEDSGN